jgi:hypothetical protein
LVALRTWHKRVDLGTLDTVVPGEYAYPMIYRGSSSARSCAVRRPMAIATRRMSQNALSELAHGVGTALHLLEIGAKTIRTSY